jgi:hypothetical protein
MNSLLPVLPYVVIFFYGDNDFVKTLKYNTCQNYDDNPLKKIMMVLWIFKAYIFNLKTHPSEKSSNLKTHPFKILIFYGKFCWYSCVTSIIVLDSTVKHNKLLQFDKKFPTSENPLIKISTNMWSVNMCDICHIIWDNIWIKNNFMNENNFHFISRYL